MMPPKFVAAGLFAIALSIPALSANAADHGGGFSVDAAVRIEGNDRDWNGYRP